MNNTEKPVKTVYLFDYRLTEINLDALASEFFGKVMNDFNLKKGTVSIEFADADGMFRFEDALKCFEIDFGGK